MFFLVLCLVVASLTVTDTSAAVDGISGLRLQDQYGEHHSLAEHNGHVTVVMVVTVKRLRNIKPWERSLREQFDDIRYLRIADVPEDSRATYASVAAKLGERVPEGVPVAIDMERAWANQLGLDTDRPNLLIFDRDGRLVTTFRGLCTPELLAPVVHRLESTVGGS